MPFMVLTAHYYLDDLYVSMRMYYTLCAALLSLVLEELDGLSAEVDPSHITRREEAQNARIGRSFWGFANAFLKAGTVEHFRIGFATTVLLLERFLLLDLRFLLGG